MEQSPYVERQTVVVADAPDGPVREEQLATHAGPHTAQRVRTDTFAGFAPDAALSAVVGLVLLVAGLVAIARAGIAAPLSTPVVSVAGFRHTAVLGLVEVGFGVMLLLSGAMRSRSASLFFGGLLGVAAFVAAVQPSSFDSSLAIETSMAWLAVIAGAAVVLAALALPRVSHRSTSIDGY